VEGRALADAAGAGWPRCNIEKERVDRSIDGRTTALPRTDPGHRLSAGEAIATAGESSVTAPASMCWRARARMAWIGEMAVAVEGAGMGGSLQDREHVPPDMARQLRAEHAKLTHPREILTGNLE